MSSKYISLAVIRRLPTYYRYLGRLMENNVERISSKELSEELQMTASQIRQDLNNFGGFGQQGYGYNVENLYNEIGKILGVDQPHNMIIIGAGNLGQALANYTTFEKRNFKIIGIFDVNPKFIGMTIRGVEIRDVDELEEFIKSNEVHMAALTIPKNHAPKVASDIVKWGVKSIWNFAPVDLKLPSDVLVENVHLLDSLMRLSYSLKALEEEKRV
ncbi:redox-sensing transcriptional repressor Rex [Anaerolentibacter hominis]|uniref:redox-sensing transcriptional repressor Rex n=1 Tax=Anaerolentibacter hominis TaxID=3079009 RepID=UPI0031B8B35C